MPWAPQTSRLLVVAGLWERLRGSLVSALIELVLRTLSSLGKLHPYAIRIRRQVRVQRNLRYADGAGAAHLLDVYRPRDREGPLPVLVYIHGGGFRILSKETHWMFGSEFARRGYLVFSINYRLARPFPEALEDVVRALKWITEHAQEYGGRSDPWVYAGESAGANLSLALAIMHCWSRPEALAREIFALPVRPSAVLPMCGMLEVGNGERYLEREELPLWLRDRIRVICRGYLPTPAENPDDHALADPLRFLESAGPPDRPLPPIFASCGTRDPVLDDTRRLGPALERFASQSEIRLYEGGIHAFQAFVWTRLARRAWEDQDAFLRALGLPALGP